MSTYFDHKIWVSQFHGSNVNVIASFSDPQGNPLYRTQCDTQMIEAAVGSAVVQRKNHATSGTLPDQSPYRSEGTVDTSKYPNVTTWTTN